MPAPANPIAEHGHRLAANIRALRKARDLTQDQLAEHLAAKGCRIGLRGVQRLEYGQRRADVDLVAALASVFQVTESSLAYSNQPACVHCHNVPPPGFTCDTCGTTANPTN